MLPKPFNSYDLDFRKRQIDTLKIFNDKYNHIFIAMLTSVLEIIENKEYLIKFESGGRIFHLKVQLSPNFPTEKPKIEISPPVQHHWVSSNGSDVETAPGLINYSQHSDLGRVVQATIREFEKHPPPFLSINEVSPNACVVSSKDGSPSHNFQRSIKKEFDLPNLSNMSLDELKKLDGDPEFFDDFIEEMSVVQHLNEELDSMINQVENISRENKTKESHLSELKLKLNDDVTALKSLGQKCDQLNLKYLKKSEEFAPQYIREVLQVAASNSDTDCEKNVEQFLNGKIDVQTFLNSYTCSKKISSERKAKEERLGHQLSALERAGI
ncbi:vacuolar protein sorting-associated protein 37A isoform X2 [Eupeodes corollae]|uniref:vacuolar protein sorting-associated protein 37A isoform X2 n=1 Tax=Eupeodes corollae TaxID=290404 RepID=UPI002492D5C1|nr:vacuolar protein sorting-associated protein 37A isoform X2 [Eupeodes corollae]